MPSTRGRIASVLVRLTTLVAFQTCYPRWYQRFVMSSVTPRLFWPKMKGVRYEPVFAGGVRAAWLIPQGAREDRVMLYFHGGGYVIGSIASHREQASFLAAAAGCAALIIDYRLAPEHPFPAALQDARAAYRWLLNNRCDPERIVLAGDSAGGGLAVALLADIRDREEPLPAGAVLLSPWTDLAMTGETIRTRARQDPMLHASQLARWATWYRGSAAADDPEVSPLYADLAGLPPIYIQVGTDEMLLDDARRLAERGRECGTDITLDEWEGMFHVFQIFASLGVPESREAVRRFGDFCRKAFDGLLIHTG